MRLTRCCAIFVTLASAAAAAPPSARPDPLPKWMSKVMTAKVGALSAPHLLTRVAVDAEGRPRSCTITRSSGNPAIDGRACALMVKRIRYSPRTDVFGDPVADIVPGYMSLTAQP